MIEFLKTLDTEWLCWFGVTFASTFFSLTNYALYWLAIIADGKFSQNTLGRVIDWFWLASVFVLTVKFIQGEIT